MEIRSKTTKGVGYRDAREYRLGFTNGLSNGFVNGNRQRLAKKKEEKKHGKILAIFLLGMLVLSVVAVLAWQSGNANAIRIDGNFDDWQGVAKTTKARDLSVPENIDIAEYATAETGKNVAFYAKVYGKMLEGDGRYLVEASSNPVYVAEYRETAIPNANGRDVAYVFIDTDNNPGTGFKPSPRFAVGAEKAIEIAGKNGKIETSRVLSFAGVVQQEWTWNIGESVAAATNGKELETMASKNMLGIGEKYAVYFYMIDWQNKECKVENALRCENAKATVFGLYLNAEAKKESMSMEVRQGTAHGPIHITSNSEFTQENGVVGGSGTQDEPYIIEGYDIDGNGGTYCIWIENTTVYFVIRNCYVFNATDTSSYPYGSGIALNNVQNGTITNNNASGNRYGIYLDYSSNNYITNNNASGNSLDGISLYYSSNNNITGNTASGNSWYGIRLESSSNNNITNNTASGRSYAGIYLYSSSNNIITNNDASDNSNCGIWIESSSNYNNITNNTASGNGYGIYLYYYSSNNNITDNNVSDNYYGIFLYYYSRNNHITNNTAIGNFIGIYLYYYSSNNHITNNTAIGNYGICLRSSSNNLIAYNWLCNNANYGVYITSISRGNIIHHNMFISNNGAGKGAIGGISQAYDDSGGNYWYDNAAMEGNYWSNWDGNGWGTASAYPIDGGMASDIYPWGGPTSEISAMPLALLGLCLCLAIAMLRRGRRK